MERLSTLIGKKFMNHQLSTDELFFQTACGETIRILSKELGKWIEFKPNHKLPSLLEKQTISNIVCYKDQIVFYFEEESSFILTEGIKYVTGIHKSDDGLEMLLKIETDLGKKETIHYFKHENTWKIAYFRQTVEDFYLKFAKKYDIINHPSVRIKTLL